MPLTSVLKALEEDYLCTFAICEAIYGQTRIFDGCFASDADKKYRD